MRRNYTNLNKCVVKQLRSGGPDLGVMDEAACQELVSLLRQLLGDCWRLSHAHPEHYLYTAVIFRPRTLLRERVSVF